jgi:MoxR-like ATPase
VKRLREKAREQIESHYKSSSSSTHANSPTTLDATSEQAELRQKLLSAFAYLDDGLVERETEIRLMMLAALSGEHLLLLGPPGTAKSELGRRLSDMCSGNFFERLLTRFSVPEELFGPLSMRSLEADRYERHIDGYLPTANVAFVDEVFKANSAILNALLTILQERLFDNGSRRISVPLVCLIGASNELPESEELDALYDRFLIRYQVEQVSQQNLQALITGSNGSSIDSTSDDDERAASQESAVGQRSGNASPLSIEDMQGVAQSAQKHVRMPDNVGQLIAGLREHLQEQCEPPVYVSDRRLVKAVSMLKVAAYTDGRTRVSEFDCLLLRHVLWQRPEEREYVSNYLLDRTVELKGAQQLRYFLGQTYSRACRVLSGVQSDEQVDKLVEDTQNLCNALSVQVAELSDSESGGLSALEQHLWMGPVDATRMSQQISPRLKKARQDVVGLLDDAVTLKVALEDGSPTYILALLLPHFWRAHVIDVRTFCFKAIGAVHFRPKSSSALAGERVRRGVSATRRAELGARREHVACVCSQRRIQQHKYGSQHSL